jgi:hypothetical protein
MENEVATAAGYKDAKGKEIEVGQVVLVPFRVIKMGGNVGPLLHLESVDAYGHINPNASGPLKGRTKTAFWVEPNQIEVQT